MLHGCLFALQYVDSELGANVQTFDPTVADNISLISAARGCLNGELIIISFAGVDVGTVTPSTVTFFLSLYIYIYFLSLYIYIYTFYHYMYIYIYIYFLSLYIYIYILSIIIYIYILSIIIYIYIYTFYHYIYIYIYFLSFTAVVPNLSSIATHFRTSNQEATPILKISYIHLFFQ